MQHVEANRGEGRIVERHRATGVFDDAADHDAGAQRRLFDRRMAERLCVTKIDERLGLSAARPVAEGVLV